MLERSPSRLDDGAQPMSGIVSVRNAEGSWSPFSVDRLARDLALEGQPLDETRETARLFLAEAQASGVGELETDDVRHWLAERDPMVFVKRRTPVGPARSELDRLANVARALAGDDGLALHLMYVDHFRPGLPPDWSGDSGQQETEKEKKPKWIEGEGPDPDELDGTFGKEADGAKLLDPEKFDDWPPEEGEADVEEPDWKDPDFSKPGRRGRYSSRYDEDFKDRKATTLRSDDGSFTAFGPGGECPVECGETWLLQFEYYEDRQDCNRVDYAAAVRSSLLLAIQEAYRRCQSTSCELVRFRIMYQSWGCSPDNRPKPVVWVSTQLAVQCWSL